jgi:hypothetical protein
MKNTDDQIWYKVSNQIFQQIQQPVWDQIQNYIANHIVLSGYVQNENTQVGDQVANHLCAQLKENIKK